MGAADSQALNGSTDALRTWPNPGRRATTLGNPLATLSTDKRKDSHCARLFQGPRLGGTEKRLEGVWVARV